MPSPDETRRLRTPDELFDHAVERGGRLRRRRQALLGGGAALALLLVAASLAFAGDDPDRVTNVATPGEGTTTSIASDDSLPIEETITTTASDGDPAPPTTRRVPAAPVTTVPAAPPTPCEPTRPVPTTGRGRILVTRDVSGSDVREIWSVDPDGSNQKRLTSGAFDQSPSWEPSGNTILFNRRGRVHIMRADGSNARPYGPNVHVSWGAAWSPDGTRIAFGSADQLWIMDADGGNARALTGRINGYPLRATWSPDGCWILFSTPMSHLYKVRSDGSGLHWFGESFGMPAWGPDGRIVVQALGIRFIDVDGNLGGALTTDESDHSPVWSPDGKRIAFARQGTDGAPHLFTMGAEGNDVVEVPLGDGYWPSDPAW